MTTNIPRAIWLYRHVMRCYPVTEDWQRIVERVGERYALWKRVLDAWRARRFNPFNVQGMLDWLDRGIPEERLAYKRATAADLKQMKTVREWQNDRR